MEEKYEKMVSDVTDTGYEGKRNGRRGADGCGGSKTTEAMRAEYSGGGQKEKSLAGIRRAVSGPSGDHSDHRSNYFRCFRQSGKHRRYHCGADLKCYPWHGAVQQSKEIVRKSEKPVFPKCKGLPGRGPDRD